MTDKKRRKYELVGRLIEKEVPTKSEIVIEGDFKLIDLLVIDYQWDSNASIFYGADGTYNMFVRRHDVSDQIILHELMHVWLADSGNNSMTGGYKYNEARFSEERLCEISSHFMLDLRVVHDLEKIKNELSKITEALKGN